MNKCDRLVMCYDSLKVCESSLQGLLDDGWEVEHLQIAQSGESLLAVVSIVVILKKERVSDEQSCDRH